MELTTEKVAPTLCLNMIVKNESKIITRLFDSVISIIDCYCICDTGSTDNTVEIIEQYFKNKSIPGKIVHEPFKNFCHNRNFSLKSCVGMSDYVLLLDADMIVDVKLFDKKILKTADNFHILQGNASFYYQNMRIIRNNGLYNYNGVTHEYIDIPPNSSISSFDKDIIFINDIGDGGCKTDKFERDIKLLTDGIKEEPTNARYYFYLANSYHDLGRYNEAIHMYKKRIELGTWKEEVWYSYHRIGLCYMKMNKMSDALWYWMEGYNYYPERLEGLYEIMKYYRVNCKNKLAFTIYNMCKNYLSKNVNRDHYLFLHNDVYKYKLYYEYTIIAAYNGITNINDEVIEVLNNGKNDNEINNLLSNIKFYKYILQAKTKYILDNKIATEINKECVDLTSSSSCLIQNNNNNGYLLNVRYVNYFITENGSYLNCDKHIITANKCIELSNDLQVVKEEWLEVVFDGRRYIGVEDVRIFYDKYKDKLIYVGTGFHQNEKIGIVSGDYNLDSKTLEINELKQNFKSSSCEKNWIFADFNNKTHIVYEWHPLKICELNEDNSISVIETKEMPNIFSRVRGSTCGFNYTKKIGENVCGNINIDIEETEIWFVGHIVSYENPRHYYHIIYVFDAIMNLLRYSAPFKFEGEPIEYCLSIIVEDDRVLMNYSTWDRTTRIGVYDKKYIDSIVKYS
jgi:tetratricopeptide (TPR) repeat protein